MLTNTPSPSRRTNISSLAGRLFLAGAASVAAVSAVLAPAQTPVNAPPPEETEIWEPAVRIVQAPANQPPSDAIRLFDGTSTEAWSNVKEGAKSWQIVDGVMVSVDGAGNIQTKQSFGDIQLHLEFRTPAAVSGTGQGRGNSGVIFMGRYEVQILDSFENATYVNGQAASVYKQHVPLVNASRPPGEWQTYDIVFVAPRFKSDGSLRAPGRLTVFHNGVLVQHDVEIRGKTTHRGPPIYTAHGEKEPLALQFHNNPIGYRNIWVRELNLPDHP
jgi:hypothetical protein